MVKPEIGLSMLHCIDKPFKSAVRFLPNLNVKHVELTDEGLHTLNKTRTKKLNEIVKISTWTLLFMHHGLE